MGQPIGGQTRTPQLPDSWYEQQGIAPPQQMPGQSAGPQLMSKRVDPGYSANYWQNLRKRTGTAGKSTVMQPYSAGDPWQVTTSKQRFNNQMQQVTNAANQMGMPAPQINYAGSGPGGTGGVGTVGGVGGGVVGGGTGGGGSLAGGYQQALDQANKANESRYQNILNEYEGRYKRGIDLLGRSGQQEALDINRNYDEARGRINQDLVSRGLRGSTIAGNMDMGNERERMDSLGRLNERIRQQQLDVDAGLSGEGLAFMERKENVAPNYNQMIALAQGMGSAGVGQQGYGGVGPGGAYPAMQTMQPYIAGWYNQPSGQQVAQQPAAQQPVAGGQPGQQVAQGGYTKYGRPINVANQLMNQNRIDRPWNFT